MTTMMVGGTSPVFVPRADVIELIDRVARDWGSTRDDVTGLRRDEPAVTARIAVICAVYKFYPQLSLRQIGSIFGRSKTWAYACVAETIGVRHEQV
jgi:chromosomal replication initiation ATPase DnaA